MVKKLIAWMISTALSAALMTFMISQAWPTAARYQIKDSAELADERFSYGSANAYKFSLVVEEHSISVADFSRFFIAGDATKSSLPQIEERIIGCWERTKRSAGENNVEYCFHSDRTISGYFLEATGEAGEIDKLWDITPKHQLLLKNTHAHDTFNGDALCEVSIADDGSSLLLSNCSVEGEWHHPPPRHDGAQIGNPVEDQKKELRPKGPQ